MIYDGEYQYTDKAIQQVNDTSQIKKVLEDWCGYDLLWNEYGRTYVCPVSARGYQLYHIQKIEAQHLPILQQYI